MAGRSELDESVTVNEEEDVSQDLEPGASRGDISVFLTVDEGSDEEIEIEAERTTKKRTRRQSSTISEIGGGAGSSGKEGHQAEDIQEKDDEDTEKNKEPSIQDLSPSLEVVEEVQGPEEWRNQKKHVFILSEAGKPIYSRHGNEDKLVTLMGVIQAIISFVQDSKDNLKYIIAGDHTFVFLVKSPVILVAVSQGAESTSQLTTQLMYLYNQILNLLTLSQLTRIFEQRRNYDLRRLLTGAEKFFDNMINMVEHDPSCMLGAVRCLPLSSGVRDVISQTIVQCCNKVKNLVFAVLVADNQLVTLVRMKKYFVHPMDLHLLFNLVSTSESLKTAESWMPICLPKFDSSGFLHGHVSYLEDDCPACLLLLTVEQDMFFALSESKQKIVEKLKKAKCLDPIAESVRGQNIKMSAVGIPELRHFLYKSKSTAQFTSPDYEAPYASAEERDRLFGLYLYLHQRIHSGTRPLKLMFVVGERETMLGWVSSGFELYATFEPLVTKPVAVNAVNNLLRWIKREEDRLFILTSPVF